jgi:uncharacterized protein (TIGR02996 family)
VRNAVRTFTCHEDGSNKFWNIALQGKSFTVAWGRVGTAGRSQTKTFADVSKAEAAHDKLVKEKLGKGYIETTGHLPADPARRALEDAVVADPDDLAAHQAYADWLNEHDDPRGEFIQGATRPRRPRKKPAERKKLQTREKELLKKHRKAARHAGGPVAETRGVRALGVPLRRGWLDRLHVHLLTADLAMALATNRGRGWSMS